MKNSLDLFFELSNEDRLSILTSLQVKPLKLTQISSQLKLPNQEVSRQLARLVALDLCYRDGEGLYNLTPYAEQAIKLIPGFEFLSKNRSYFKTHTARGLPLEFQLRIGELSSCVPLSDVMTTLYDIQQKITEATEYIWFITEQGNIMIGGSIEDAIRRGVEYKVILPRNITPSEPYTHYIKGWGPDHPLRSSKAQRRYLDSLPVALNMSEKEAPQILFPTLEGKLDYTGFKANGGEAHRWCRDLFRYYWENASTEAPKRLRDLLRLDQ